MREFINYLQSKNIDSYNKDKSKLVIEKNHNEIELHIQFHSLGYIYLSGIYAKIKGKGLGSFILQLLKEYCDKFDYTLVIYKVANHGFFGKFSWLECEGSSYKYLSIHLRQVRRRLEYE